MQKEKCENAMWRNALDTEVKCLWRSAARARIRNRTNDALTGFNEERFFFMFTATALKLVMTVLWKTVHVQYKPMENKCAKLKQI